MMLSLTILLSLIITVNLILWRTYRRGLLEEIQELDQRLEARDADVERAYCYIDELQQRCRRYRNAMHDEALDSQVQSGQAIRLYLN